MTVAHRSVDYHQLMKKVEAFATALEGTADVGTTIRVAAEAIVVQFREQLGIYGGRLYHWNGENYALITTFPEAKPVEGITVPASYPPIVKVLSDGTLFMTASDPGVDRLFEDQLGVEHFAAIEVAEEEYILAFNVLPGLLADDVLFSLGILRHTLNQKIDRQRVAGVFKEARIIQTSILPKRSPAYGPYEIAGKSKPMETVGGDFYDYIPITDKIMGLAIADVSGHGLPAALQVRDIYTGLRMGMARDFKIVRTVERLNKIIHESTLTSRFVSMFYGELELHGLFIYVNAGHPPPFRLRAADGGVDFLQAGGAVLGPLPEATYERGFVTVQPGDVIVMYTDGIVETLGPDETGRRVEFGEERLLETVRAHRERSATEIVDAVFSAVRSFSHDEPAADDRTVVVVRYPGEKPPIESQT